MKIYYKEWSQTIPGSMEKVWHHFSRPENLDKLTPENMAFQIISDIKDRPMYEGMIIRYRVSPVLNIPLNWATEITHIKDREYFIDEQRFGPYTLWHHEHHFEETPQGILMKDQLHYAIPFGIFGRIANAIFVEARIDEIFTYRQKCIDEIFV